MNRITELEQTDSVKGERTDFQGAKGNLIVGEVWHGLGDESQKKANPVLLLHGGGQTRHAWEETAVRLARKGYTAVTVDQRGHGESGWLPEGNYSFHGFADDVRQLAVALQEKYKAKPIVVGASLGGIGALIAEGHYQPGLCESIVFVDITPRVNPSGVSKILEFMGDKVEQGFASLEEAAAVIEKYIPNRKRPKNLNGLKKNLKLCDDGRYRWHWDPKFISSKKEYHINDREFEDMLVKAAQSLKLPVLLMRGSQSDLVSEEHVEEFLNLVPHGKFVDITGAGHMVAGDRNDIFADTLLDFLAGGK